MEEFKNNNYKMSPSSKEDWSRIVEEMKNGSYVKEEGSYGVMPRNGGYFLGKFQRLGSELILMDFDDAKEKRKAYDLSGLKEPREDRIFEHEDVFDA